MEKVYFKKLGLDARVELTCNYGELISAVETSNRYFTLFLLDGFFVELHINRLNNDLEDVVLQEDPDILYEYIRDLNIDEAIN